MFIGVIDSSTGDMIFQGDADDFLETTGYDEEIEEGLNKLSSPGDGNGVTRRAVGEYILLRGRR